MQNRLIEACQKNELEAADLAMQAGADVNTLDKDGLAPIHHAVLQDNEFDTP